MSTEPEMSDAAKSLTTLAMLGQMFDERVPVEIPRPDHAPKHLRLRDGRALDFAHALRQSDGEVLLMYFGPDMLKVGYSVFTDDDGTPSRHVSISYQDGREVPESDIHAVGQSRLFARTPPDIHANPGSRGRSLWHVFQAITTDS